jgi:hypothetical protein
MFCVMCGSGNQMKFLAEVLVHFAGLKNLDKPGVFLFPDLLVCLDCGSSQFSVPPEKELALLASRAPISERSTAQRGVDEHALPLELIL